MKVIFRKFEDDQVIALFPEQIEGPGLISSYMEIGQHSAASIELIDDLSQCNSVEVAAGLKMVQAVGYKNLIVSKGL